MTQNPTKKAPAEMGEQYSITLDVNDSPTIRAQKMRDACGYVNDRFGHTEIMAEIIAGYKKLDAICTHPTDEPVDEMGELMGIVNHQAEDDGLWFQAETISEAYLQQELRKLHAAIEARARLNTQGWQSIENAPKDECICLFSPESCYPIVIGHQFNDGSKEWYPQDETTLSGSAYDVSLTHYRPLPAPPSARLNQAGDA